MADLISVSSDCYLTKPVSCGGVIAFRQPGLTKRHLVPMLSNRTFCAQSLLFRNQTRRTVTGRLTPTRLTPTGASGVEPVSGGECALRECRLERRGVWRARVSASHPPPNGARRAGSGGGCRLGTVAEVYRRLANAATRARTPLAPARPSGRACERDRYRRMRPVSELRWLRSQALRVRGSDTRCGSASDVRCARMQTTPVCSPHR